MFFVHKAIPRVSLIYITFVDFNSVPDNSMYLGLFENYPHYSNIVGKNIKTFIKL